MTGHSPTALLRLKLDDLVHGDAITAIMKYCSPYEKSGLEPWPFTLGIHRLKKKDGQLVPMTVTCQLIDEPDRKLIMVQFRKIKDRKA